MMNMSCRPLPTSRCGFWWAIQRNGQATTSCRCTQPAVVSAGAAVASTTGPWHGTAAQLPSEMMTPNGSPIEMSTTTKSVKVTTAACRSAGMRTPGRRGRFSDQSAKTKSGERIAARPISQSECRQ